MPLTYGPGTKNFQTERWEKTLTLACALQACTKRLWALTGVLCNCVRELQRCMVPLMYLSGNEIVEASLLEPTGEEHGTSPTLEEEAGLLGKESKLPETSNTTSLPEHLEIPEPRMPTEWINTRPMEPSEHTDFPSTSPSPSPMPKRSSDPSQKIKKYKGGIGADPNHTSEWVHSSMQKNE